MALKRTWHRPGRVKPVQTDTDSGLRGWTRSRSCLKLAQTWRVKFMLYLVRQIFVWLVLRFAFAYLRCKRCEQKRKLCEHKWEKRKNSQIQTDGQTDTHTEYLLALMDMLELGAASLVMEMWRKRAKRKYYLCVYRQRMIEWGAIW